MHPSELGFDEESPGSIHIRARLAQIFLVLELELILLQFLRWPSSHNFALWAFGDPGATFVLHYLTSHGLRPNVDFGCNFGLLPVIVARLLYGTFGYSRLACSLAYFIFTSVIIFGLSRVTAHAGAKAATMALLICAVPYALPNDFGHGIEGALLSNALADHLQRRYRRALALVAAACFAEPSMPYIYGSLLSVFALTHLYRTSSLTRESVMSTFVPATCIVSASAVALSLWFGSASVVRTIIPVHGMTNYHAAHYGLFASRLLYFSGVHPGWYLGTVAGFWIVSSLWLIVSGMFFGICLYQRDDSSAEFILTCALLELTFALLMFGSMFSTMYYFYILLAGIVVLIAISEHVAFTRLVVTLLVALAFLGHRTEAVSLTNLWRHTGPQMSMSGMWETPAAGAEWAHLAYLRQGHRAVIVGITQAANLMFGGFESPVALYLTPGYLLDSEQTRVTEQIQTADVVIVPANLLLRECTCYRSIENAMREFRMRWHGLFFEAYQRTATHAPDIK